MAHSFAAAASLLTSLLVLLLEDFENPQVATDLLDVGLREQIDRLRLGLLPIAIHPPVALLEHHQRPRQVKVHQAMAKEVEVQAFGGNVRTEQHAQLVILATEAIHKLLLVRVVHLAVQHGDLIRLQTQIGRELL